MYLFTRVAAFTRAPRTDKTASESLHSFCDSACIPPSEAPRRTQVGVQVAAPRKTRDGIRSLEAAKRSRYEEDMSKKRNSWWSLHEVKILEPQLLVIQDPSVPTTWIGELASVETPHCTACSFEEGAPTQVDMVYVDWALLSWVRGLYSSPKGDSKVCLFHERPPNQFPAPVPLRNCLIRRQYP